MMVPDERGHGSVQAQANGTIKWENRCHTICDFWERQRERKWSIGWLRAPEGEETVAVS